MSDKTLEQKIQKLEADIMLRTPMRFLDPIKDHRYKVQKFTIERKKLIDNHTK